MNNKTLYAALIALPVAVGAPMGGAAFAGTTSAITITRSGNSANTNIKALFNPSGISGPTTGIQTTNTTGGSWPLRRPAVVQLSAGVVMVAAATNGPDNAGAYNNIVVGTGHQSGNSVYGGDTSGGSVTECPVSGSATSCPTSFTSNSPDAANIANTAFSKL